MTANAEEVETLMRVTDEVNSRFVNGDFGGYQALYAHSQETTVFGPFGGHAKGWAAIGAAVPSIARLFASGSSEIIPISSHQSGDLFVSVHIEEQTATFVGGREPQNWSLRVTQVYRREAGGWRVVHRHADPLVERRSVEATRALAGDVSTLP